MIVALEGGDGCGKGTVAKWLVEEHGFVGLADPGATPLSLHLRELLLHRTEMPMDERQLALVFAASTVDVLKKARDHEARGCRVVLDRTFLSNFAYRMARGMPMAHLKILVQLFMPEHGCVGKVLYLATPWAVRKARLVARGGTDRFEGAADEFHLAVEAAYEALATAGMAEKVDASGSIDDVKAKVRAALLL